MAESIEGKTNELRQWSEALSKIWNELHLGQSIDMDLFSNACEAINDIANEIDSIESKAVLKGMLLTL